MSDSDFEWHAMPFFSVKRRYYCDLSDAQKMSHKIEKLEEELEILKTEYNALAKQTGADSANEFLGEVSRLKRINFFLESLVADHAAAIEEILPELQDIVESQRDLPKELKEWIEITD